jgi:hypothetical protein
MLVRRIAGRIDLHQGSTSFSFRRRPRAFMGKRFLTEGKLRYESGRMGDAAPRLAAVFFGAASSAMSGSGNKMDIAFAAGDVRCWGAGSTGRRNTDVKSLCWGFKLQGLTWSFVELTSHSHLVTMCPAV